MFSIYKLIAANNSDSIEEYFSSLELLCDAMKQTTNCNIGTQNMEYMLSAEQTIYEKYPVVVLGEYMIYAAGTSCILSIQEVPVND